MADDRTPAPPGALAGIRVLEFAQNLAIPSCGRMLAAMGAEVIKVEPPAGDAARTLGPFPGLREGRAYAVANPGKRSVVLDLGDARTHAARDALLRTADVVLCAFKGPDLERYGLGYEHVAALNPRVIYLEHRALGAEGPDRDEGGYDVLVQALSGLSFITSRSEPGPTGQGRPLTVRPAYSDMATGLSSAAAVLGALYHRERTGEGQRVRTSLLATAHWLAMPMSGRFEHHDREQLDEFHADLAALRAADAGFDDQRALYESRVLPASGNFDLTFRHYLTADAMVAVGALSPSLIDRFYAVTGLPDPRAANVAYRSAEWNAIVAQAEALLRSETTAHWLARFRAAGVPCSRYHLPTEAMDDPGAVANRFVEDIEHPVLGPYRTTTAPLVMERSPVRTTGPSPALGADTDAVLAAAGLDEATITALHAAGVTRAR